MVANRYGSCWKVLFKSVPGVAIIAPGVGLQVYNISYIGEAKAVKKPVRRGWLSPEKFKIAIWQNVYLIILCMLKNAITFLFEAFFVCVKFSILAHVLLKSGYFNVVVYK